MKAFVYFSSLLVVSLVSATSHVGFPKRPSWKEAARRLQGFDDPEFQKCNDESEILHNKNPPLDTSGDALYNEADVAFDQVCPELDDGEPIVDCDFDFKNLPSYNDYVSACAAAGGVLYLTRFFGGCSGSTFGAAIDYSVTVVNMPACLITTCDINVVTGVLDSFFGSLYEGIEVFVEVFSGQDTVDCNSDFSHTDSNGISVAELAKQQQGSQGFSPLRSSAHSLELSVFQFLSVIASIAAASWYLIM